MIVLHASAWEDQLVLWAEAPAAEQKPRRSNRSSAWGAPEALPFDAGGDAIAEAIRGVVPGPALKAGDFEKYVITLPTLRGRPIASSPMVAEPPSNGVKPQLETWAVTGLPLEIEQTAALLASCVGKDVLAPGVIIGSTLRYWTQVFRFAGALVVRQQFLPGVRQDGDGEFRACWEPVTAGPEGPRQARLSRAMPHAARALNLSPWGLPSEGESVLSTFLRSMVDFIVRTAIPAAAPAPGPKPKRTKKTRARAFASIHDQWVHALAQGDGQMVDEQAELLRLAEQVRQWRRPIEREAVAPFRLCFRLEEPESENDHPAESWYVRYLLQANDDPSLLLPAEKAWHGAVAGLRQLGFVPREYLLAALGQASSLCPRIEGSLRAAKPVGYALDIAGAHEFLTEKSWLLEQAGFGVLLPSWWTRKGTKLRLGAKASIKSPVLQTLGGLSLDEVLKFQWQVALGDQTLTLAELKALAKLKEPLVKVRGQWVQLTAEEIQAALEFWKKKSQRPIKARDAVRLALGIGQVPSGLEFEGVEAEGWFADLLQQLRGGDSFEMLEPPEGFQGSLRPYQARGYSWLAFLRRWGLGACLADDMGLGKTVQTLVAIEREWETAEKRRPTLLVCPMSVVGNWQKEATRFTPDLPVLVHHGLGRTRGAAFKKAAAKHALVLTSYALLHRDFALLEKISWAGVVLDEAQNIKNPDTKQARAARALNAEARIALTGTPVENHVGDLWSIMEFLNPGLLGTQTEFRRSFHVPIQAYRDPDATRTLQRITGPFILRRVKTDKSIIADLPDKMEMKVFCNLTKEQATLYQAVADEAAEAITNSAGIRRKGIILATLSKLKQVCNHPAQFLGDNSVVPGRSGKLARLTEMLEEALSAGDRALVFSQFAEMGTILRTHLQETFGREVLFLHGGVSKTQRDRMVERFQSNEEDGPRIFILSLKAGGTGLNLTAANHVFHFDRWWNPAVENQATDRAFRIGQKRKVQVHKFLCIGTLEEKIDEMIERKQKIAGAVVGSGEDWLTKLSTKELKNLFALRQEALAE